MDLKRLKELAGVCEYDESAPSDNADLDKAKMYAGIERPFRRWVLRIVNKETDESGYYGGIEKGSFKYRDAAPSPMVPREDALIIPNSEIDALYDKVRAHLPMNRYKVEKIKV